MCGGGKDGVDRDYGDDDNIDDYDYDYDDDSASAAANDYDDCVADSNMDGTTSCNFDANIFLLLILSWSL